LSVASCQFKEPILLYAEHLDDECCFVGSFCKQGDGRRGKTTGNWQLATGNSVMLTLGIDPGTAIMGYGLVESDGRRLSTPAFGVLTTEKGTPPEQRLRLLYAGLVELIALRRPAAVAVEELFFNVNVRTALAVGQARGVALLAAAQADLPVYEYTPPQVKGAVVGYGRASKEQVQLMTTTLLGLRSIPKPDDAADALAVAICHAHSATLLAAGSAYINARGGTKART